MMIKIKFVISGIGAIGLGMLILTVFPDIGWYPPTIFIAFGVLLLGTGAFLLVAPQKEEASEVREATDDGNAT